MKPYIYPEIQKPEILINLNQNKKDYIIIDSNSVSEIKNLAKWGKSLTLKKRKIVLVLDDIKFNKNNIKLIKEIVEKKFQIIILTSNISKIPAPIKKLFSYNKSDFKEQTFSERLTNFLEKPFTNYKFLDEIWLPYLLVFLNKNHHNLEILKVLEKCNRMHFKVGDEFIKKYLVCSLPCKNVKYLQWPTKKKKVDKEIKQLSEDWHKSKREVGLIYPIYKKLIEVEEKTKGTLFEF